MAKMKTSERVYNMWRTANSEERVKWQSSSQKGYDFYLNDQLTSKEKSALEEAGMPTFQINRITPIIETMKYFVTANNPRWKAVGVDGSDANIAQIHSDISDYCWGLSNGKSVYGSVILDCLAKGCGYFFVDVDMNLDNGKGDVVFKRIDPYDVYPDPMSRDFLFRDAAFIIVKKVLTRSQLNQMFPEHKRKIKKASEQGIHETYSQADRNDSDAIIAEDIITTVSESGEKDDKLDYYECYERVRLPFYNLTIQIHPTPEDLENVKMVSEQRLKEYVEESQVATQEKILNIERQLQAGEIIEERAALEVDKAKKALEYGIKRKKSEIDYATQEELNRTESKVVSEEEYKELIKNEAVMKTILDATLFHERRIKVSCCLGSDTNLYEYILPITDFPIIPIPYLYTGTPYPMSAVIPMIGKQQEVNKAHQVMLHNANLASNLRWLYEEGSVPEEEWEQYSSAPGALLKYRQGFNAPTPVLPASINNAFFTVTQEGKSDMEYIAGIPSAMMGFAQEQAETYRGLLANDEFGTRRIKAWMNSVLEPALEHTGKVFKEHAQAHYQIDKVFRIVQPNTAGDYDQSETRINIPIYNDYGEQIQLWNDYASSRFDVRIVAGAVMPINRWALLEEYFRWFQAGLIDDVAMLAETDVRGKEKILERKSLYAQLQQQVEGMKSQMQDKEGENETLKRQLIQAGIRHGIDTGSKTVDKEVLETQAQQKYYRKLMEDDLKRKTEKELEENKKV